MPIVRSVGRSGGNLKQEVQYVQALLNIHRQRQRLTALKLDGLAGPKTIEAIEEFQRNVVGIRPPDGRVDPGARTIAALEAPNDSAARELLAYTAIALALTADPSLQRPLLNGRDAVAMVQAISVARG